MNPIARELLSCRSLISGPGQSTAPRVYLALWSHARWPKGKNRGGFGLAFVGADALAAEVGSDVRTVRRALALLEKSGLISRSWRRVKGKMLKVSILAPTASPEVRAALSSDAPVVKLPSPAEIREIKSILAGLDTSSSPTASSTLRRGCRPGPALALAMALYAAWSVECRGHMRAVPHALTTSMAALRDMSGAASESHFRERLDRLEAAGLVRRVGEHWGAGIVVVPVLTVLLGRARASKLASAPARPVAVAVATPRSQPRRAARRAATLADPRPLEQPPAPVWTDIDGPAFEHGLEQPLAPVWTDPGPSPSPPGPSEPSAEELAMAFEGPWEVAS